MYVLTECIINLNLNLHLYMTFHVTSHRLAHHGGHVTALCHSSLIFSAVRVTRCSCLCPCHYGILGSRGKFHSFLNSTLERCEWPTPRPGPFPPGTMDHICPVRTADRGQTLCQTTCKAGGSETALWPVFVPHIQLNTA
jgi:hypothetical protein